MTVPTGEAEVVRPRATRSMTAWDGTSGETLEAIVGLSITFHDAPPEHHMLSPNLAEALAHELIAAARRSRANGLANAFDDAAPPDQRPPQVD